MPMRDSMLVRSGAKSKIRNGFEIDLGHMTVNQLQAGSSFIHWKLADTSGSDDFVSKATGISGGAERRQRGGSVFECILF